MSKFIKWSIGIGIFFILVIIMVALSKYSEPTAENFNNPVAAKRLSDSIQRLNDSIQKRKQEAGVDYKIIKELPRYGKDFSILVMTTDKKKASVTQLKMLGEIIRDENIALPFVTAAFYDDAKYAKEYGKSYNIDLPSDIQAMDKEQTHMIAQYVKNNTSNLHFLEIYPSGFVATKYEQIIKINY